METKFTTKEVTTAAMVPASLLGGRGCPFDAEATELPAALFDTARLQGRYDAWSDLMNRDLVPALSRWWTKPYGSRTDMARTILDEASRAGLDPLLGAALIKRMAAFNPKNLDGSRRMLLPVSPETLDAIKLQVLGAKSFCVDPYGFRWNMRAGFMVLRGQLDLAGGDVRAALAAYQATHFDVEARGAPDLPNEILIIAKDFKRKAGDPP